MIRRVANTVRVKLHRLTQRKSALLEREYDAFQTAVQGGDARLYSATKQQASKVQRQKNPRSDTEQPVVLRNDVLDVAYDTDTVLSSWWIRVPVYDPERDRGNSIWCPAIVPEKDDTLVREGTIRDSELVRHDSGWFVHLVIERREEIRETYDDVLAIDMGARWVATSVALSTRQTSFYGKNVRQLREHYKQLRKSIGKSDIRQGNRVIRRLGDAESRKVDDCLHKISRTIVDDAVDRNAAIAIGDLGGIREGTDKGRHFNDKLHKMPFAKLLSYIEYKAHREGIEVVLVDEAYTSQICNRCTEKGTRNTQGRFRCPNCGLDDNADKNGATNIGKRVLGKFSKPLSETGAALARPGTQVVVEPENSQPRVSLTLCESTSRIL